MATRLYNVRAYEQTATAWGTDTNIYPKNSLLFVTGTGADKGRFKRGDGTNEFKDLEFVKGEAFTLTSPDSTVYELNVADGGALTAEPVV